MLTIETRGTPFERGKQQGELLSKQIKDAYQEWVMKKEKISFPLNSFFMKMHKYINQKFPDALEELKGIAEGSNMSEEQIFLLNTFNSYLSLNHYCTVMVIRGKDDKAFIAKTHDISEEEMRYTRLNRIITEQGEQLISIGVAGTIWTVAGINNHGLAVAGASAPSSTQQDGVGLPQHMTYSLVLKKCKSTQEAVKIMDSIILCGQGINTAVADNKGNATCIEKTQCYMGIHPDTGSSMGITNHFTMKEMTKFNDYLKEGCLANSKARLFFLQKELVGKKFSNPKTQAKNIMGKTGFEGALCQRKANNVMGYETHFGFILDPYAKCISVSEGTPENCTYKDFYL